MAQKVHVMNYHDLLVTISSLSTEPGPVQLNTALV